MPLNGSPASIGVGRWPIGTSAGTLWRSFLFCTTVTGGIYWTKTFSAHGDSGWEPFKDFFETVKFPSSPRPQLRALAVSNPVGSSGRGWVFADDLDSSRARIFAARSNPPSHNFDTYWETWPTPDTVDNLAIGTLTDGNRQLWASSSSNGKVHTRWNLDQGPSNLWADGTEPGEHGPIPSGQALRQIVVGRLSNGALQLWAVDVTGRLFSSWKTSAHPDASWTPWSDFFADVDPVPPHATYDVFSATACEVPVGRLQLWIRTNSGYLYTTTKTSSDPNSSWSQWSSFSRPPSTGAVNYLYASTVGSAPPVPWLWALAGSEIWSTRKESSTGPWMPWTRFNP
jgi:hypothetical protein